MQTLIEFTLPELPDLPLPDGIPLPQQVEVLGRQISTMYVLIAGAILALLILTLIIRAIRRRTRPVIAAGTYTEVSPSPSPSKSKPKHMKK